MNRRVIQAILSFTPLIVWVASLAGCSPGDPDQGIDIPIAGVSGMQRTAPHPAVACDKDDVIRALGFDPEGPVESPRPEEIDATRFQSLPPLDESHSVTLHSSDGVASITVFDRMVALSDLNAAAQIQAGAHDLNVFTIVMNEAKTSFSDTPNLDAYLQLSVANLQQTLGFARVGETVAMQVGAHAARQVHLSGIAAGLEVEYLVTVVDGGETLHQIISFTSRYRWGTYLPTLQRIALSFRTPSEPPAAPATLIAASAGPSETLVAGSATQPDAAVPQQAAPPPEAGPPVTSAPLGGTSGELDLLAGIDPIRDAVSAPWRRGPDGLVSPPSGVAGLLIRSPPPESYRLTAIVERLHGRESFNMALVVGGRTTMAVFEGWGRGRSALNTVDGRTGDNNVTTYSGPIFAPGQPTQIVCEVRPREVRVTCDGRLVIHWQGDPNRLALDQRFWRNAPEGRLFVATWMSSYRLSRLTLTPLPQ